jgi:hypothetical protein
MFPSLSFSSFEAEKWQEKLFGFSPAIKTNYEKENSIPKINQVFRLLFENKTRFRMAEKKSSFGLNRMERQNVVYISDVCMGSI